MSEKNISLEEWVDGLIIEASRNRASDIHIDPYETKANIRFRIDGVLVPVSEQPKSSYDVILRRIKVIGSIDTVETRKPQDGRGEMLDPTTQKKLEFRISSIPTIYGEAVVIRFIDQTKAIFDSFEAMGMSPEDSEMFRNMIAKPYGMILITGPAGSGKTSTLYTALNQLRSPEKNIITLEDPVEFHLDYIRHCQIKPEVDFTFAEGMKAVLRQDPDVIFIGEIRDHETAEISVRAALSGRFVFSNISTNDAAGTITRFLELGIPRSFLATSLIMAVSKRLLRKNCPVCSVPYQPSEKFMQESGMANSVGATFMKGPGCEKCNGHGYFERIPVFEFFVVSKEIAELITDGATSKELIDMAKSQGMKTLRESAVALAAKGLVTLEDAIYIT